MEIKRLKPSMLNKYLVTYDINMLLCQLSENAKSKSEEDLKRVISQPQMVFMAALDEGRDELIGIGAIYCYETLIGKTGIIEDMVVDEKYRGRGIGDALLKALIEEEKKEKAEFIDLTSKPERAAAIAMYKKHGFKKRDTNCFRLIL